MNCGVVEVLSEQTANPDFILVKASKEGDSTAFARLVGPCQGRLLALALAITRNREDAEDVAQKSLLQAFVHLDAFHGGSRFSTWLMRIAINEALMNLRKRMKVPRDRGCTRTCTARKAMPPTQRIGTADVVVGHQRLVWKMNGTKSPRR